MKFFNVNYKPSKRAIKILGVIPFVMILILYGVITEKRHSENENEKITPKYTEILDAAKVNTFEKKEIIFNPIKDQKEYKKEILEERKICQNDNKEIFDNKNDLKKYCEENIKTESKLLNDIKSSIYRLILGILLASTIGFFVGINMGIFKSVEATFLPLVTFLSIIPPLALLPIFMITMGTGEIVKIMIIFFGLVFVFTRDIYEVSKNYPKEMFIKALTLGATNFEIVYKIIAPQIIPNLIKSIRINLGAAWLFLIAGEAMSATSGLGYNIFLVKRYMSMDVIIFYVLVITIIGILLDKSLYLLNKKLFPWFEDSASKK